MAETTSQTIEPWWTHRPGGRPLASVGMPVYNGARYLDEAIRSVLAQDIGNLELVISDNGSTDGTERICREAASRDPRVRYVREDDNRGAAWNYNRVLELSRGTYFHWAASDDRFEPSYLSRCVGRLASSREVVLAFATTIIIDGDGRPRQTWLPPTDYATSDRPVDRFRDVLWHAVNCVEVFGVTRREDLLKTQQIAPFTGSDRSLLAELALRGKFDHVDAALFANRDHGGSSMHTHPDPVERARWFDPTSEVRFPHWRLLNAFVRAAWRSAPCLWDRLGAALVIPAWAWRERGALIFDVLRALPEPVPRWALSVREGRKARRARPPVQ